MPFSLSLRNLLLGKEHIPDRRTFKYALLRAQFTVLTILVALYYVGLDLFNGAYKFIPYYLVMVVISAICLHLNRIGKYTSSSVLLLLMTNTVIFLFSDVDHPHGGVYFYFVTCALAALVLYGYQQRYLGISFALFSIGLGLLAYQVDLNLIDRPSDQPEAVTRNFISNFVIGILTSSFVVFFLIKRNHDSERASMESTEQLKKTTEDLNQSQERYALALRGTKAGIYEWQVANNQMFISPYYKSLLGYHDDELAELTPDFYLAQVVHPEDLARMRENLAHPELVAPTYQSELRLKTKSGEYKWFLDSGVLKRSPTGAVEMVVGSIIDIDERKKAEEEIRKKNVQLAKTNEELDRFVYSASHDMRAPLSSLLGLIHLSEKTNQPEELHLYLAMMKERIKTMEGFIREVTDYSRNTRLDITPSEIILKPLLREIANALAYSVENKKVRLLWHVPDDLIVTTDASRLKVVLNNLISNAYKYHDQKKSERFIKISAGRMDGKTWIHIEDNGIGIAPEHQHRIFDMFYRASETSEGSGLGLYIVKETLQKLGGTISVSSEPEQGATFSFSVPDLS